MFEGHTVAVVVPARNEEHQLPRVLREMPTWVDKVFVVDDASQDHTARVARVSARRDPRVHLLCHPRRQGVGGAIATGYTAALQEETDVVAVMAGDHQMDPSDLPNLLAPVVRGHADYAKGDRFAWPGGVQRIPLLRRLGNHVLTTLTRVITGLGHLSDAQCGYTAIAREALERLDLDSIYRGYGYPNDVLTRLVDVGARVTEVPVRPRYGVGERSKLHIPLVVLPIAWLLLRAALRRLRSHPPAPWPHGSASSGR